MKMKVIEFSQMPTIQSKCVTQYRTRWNRFVRGMCQFGHTITEKKNYRIPLISFSTFSKGRKKKNIVSVNGVILDFDGGLAVPDIEQSLLGLNYLMYSTHSHMSDGVTDKVRIVLPFKEPCSADDWYLRVDAAKKRFSGCDPSSLLPTQFQAMPNCPKSRSSQAFIRHNRGSFFEWRALPAAEPETRKPDLQRTVNSGHATAHKRITADTIIHHKTGQTAAGSIDRHIKGVYCPNHPDKTPTEFADVNAEGEPFIHCKSCGTLWVDRTDDHLEVDKHTYEAVAPTATRDLIHAIVDNLGPTNLIYAPEGVGKSYSAVLLHKAGRKVLFACNSYRQVAEKFTSFSTEGLRVKLLESRAYRIEKLYNVKPIRTNNRHPWDVGEIDEKATIAEINQNRAQAPIDRIDYSCDVEPIPHFDWSDCDMYLTTHAYLAHVGRINHDRVAKGNRPLLDDGVAVIFDDPTVHDVSTLAPYSDLYENKRIDASPIEEHTTIRDNRRYVVRPDRYKLGFGLSRCTLIVTTTELLIKLLFKQQHPNAKVFDELMPDEGKLLTGDVHMVSTKLVRSKFDGILSPIVERIKRLGFDFEYIANGQGCTINLNNNKGVNDLADQNIVVELSIPTPQESLLLYEQFDGALSQREVIAALMLDKLNQAIGRNSGFRSRGKSCVVLVDPNYAKVMLKMSRYAFKSATRPDPEQPMLYPRRQPEFTNLVDAICWFINRYRVYTCDGRKFYHDCVKAVKVVSDNARNQRLQRINCTIMYLMSLHPGDRPKLKDTRLRLNARFNHQPQ